MPGIVIGVSGDGNSSGVLTDINEFFSDAHIELVDKVEVQGEYACFKCGYGNKCDNGGIAEIYEIPIEIAENKVPTLACQHPEEKNTYNIIGELKDAGQKLTEKIHNLK